VKREERERETRPYSVRSARESHVGLRIPRRQNRGGIRSAIRRKWSSRNWGRNGCLVRTIGLERGGSGRWRRIQRERRGQKKDLKVNRSSKRREKIEDLREDSCERIMKLAERAKPLWNKHGVTGREPGACFEWTGTGGRSLEPTKRTKGSEQRGFPSGALNWRTMIQYSTQVLLVVQPNLAAMRNSTPPWPS
jgi:hypothetical protein